VILGIFFGIFSGGFVAFIIEYFDNTIKSIDQIERRGIYILAIIPAIKKNKKNRKSRKYLSKMPDVDKLQRRLITTEDPKSPISEAYRGLRTSMMYNSSNKKCSIILVSSSGPGEGKTTTIANTAITYANLDKKTLLIDADLRKPVIHNIFKLDKTPGLTSYLSGYSNIDQIINKSDIPNLDILTSGIIPPNPSELLNSKKMEGLLEKLKDKYDVIMFDTPPLIAVTDGYILMKFVTQFMLVIRSGVTQKLALERVLNDLKHNNIKLSGAVLNAVSEEHTYGAGYYDYYQYYASESNEK